MKIRKLLQFKHGILVSVNNINVYHVNNTYEDSYYGSTLYEIDNQLYDLEILDNINNIPIPTYDDFHGDVTKYLEYMLRMSAYSLRDDGKISHFYACLRKANTIMSISPMIWDKNAYLRIVKYLLIDDRFEEAEKEEKYLENLLPEVFDERVISLKRLNYALELCNDFNTDLLIISSHKNCCGECSKYQGRVYSINGVDTRYPKLPDFIKSTGQICDNCRHDFFPFTHGDYNNFDEEATSQEKIIARSNRPFVDERTSDEILEYKKYEERMYKESHWKEEIIENAIKKRPYKKICEMYPDIAPKSFNGYMRMKNANTKNYQKLIAYLNEHGFPFDDFI